NRLLLRGCSVTISITVRCEILLLASLPLRLALMYITARLQSHVNSRLASGDGAGRERGRGDQELAHDHFLFAPVHAAARTGPGWLGSRLEWRSGRAGWGHLA